jgi:hypothetical protein
MTICVVCIDQGAGKYLAFDSYEPRKMVVSYTRAEAIVAYLEKFQKERCEIVDMDEELETLSTPRASN